MFSASFLEKIHVAVSGTKKTKLRKKPATKKQVSERHHSPTTSLT